MVSEKLIVVLITLAILMSIASIVITISSINTNLIPQFHPKETVLPDSKNSNVGLVILKPAPLPENEK